MTKYITEKFVLEGKTDRRTRLATTTTAAAAEAETTS